MYFFKIRLVWHQIHSLPKAVCNIKQKCLYFFKIRLVWHQIHQIHYPKQSGTKFTQSSLAPSSPKAVWHQVHQVHYLKQSGTKFTPSSLSKAVWHQVHTKFTILSLAPNSLSLVWHQIHQAVWHQVHYPKQSGTKFTPNSFQIHSPKFHLSIKQRCLHFFDIIFDIIQVSL